MTKLSCLMLPNDLLGPHTRRRGAGNLCGEVATTMKYLYLHTGVCSSSLPSSPIVRILRHTEDAKVVFEEIVNVMEYIQGVDRLVLEVTATRDKAIDQVLMETLIRFIDRAKIREINLIEHNHHSASDADCDENKEKVLQLKCLGEAIRRNLHIRRLCLWPGSASLLLSHLAPNSTIERCDISIGGPADIDARQRNRDLIDVLPRLTGLQSFSIHTSGMESPVKLSRISLKFFKADLMSTIRQCPRLCRIQQEGTFPLFDKEERAQIDKWITRNEEIATLVTPGSASSCSRAAISSAVIPNLFERIQELSTRNDVVYELLRGPTAFHVHLNT